MKTKHWMMALFAVFALGFTIACEDDDNGGGNDAGVAGDMGTGGADGGAQGDGGGTTDDASTEPTAEFCAEECSDDSDCLFAGGTESNYTCNTETGRCEKETSAGGCADDEACMAKFSGWTTSCTKNDDCTGQVCISNAGGVCATLSTTLDCSTVNQAELNTTYQDSTDGTDVTVCADQNHTCLADGTCGCTDDAACSALAATPTCDTDTGRCVCGTDTCGDDGVCREDGMCGCTADAYCGGRGVCDTETATCVCNDASTDCTADLTFDGTTWVCAAQ